MTINDVFKKATFGNRKVRVFDDYKAGSVAVYGNWYEDRMMEYREKHEADPVELISENDVLICVALKGESK